LRSACQKVGGEGVPFGLVCFGQGDPGDLGDIPCHSLGWLGDESSLSLAYSAADVVALPSRMDNLPNTGVEAAACGRPVVTFGTGGIPDIVEDGKTGFLCPVEDSDALAESISRLLGSPELVKEMGKAARLRAEMLFSTKALVPKFVKMYESAQ